MNLYKKKEVAESIGLAFTFFALGVATGYVDTQISPIEIATVSILFATFAALSILSFTFAKKYTNKINHISKKEKLIPYHSELRKNNETTY